MKLVLNKSDSIGALASTLCMIHCLITPFIFIVQSCTASCCDSTPIWWQWIDYMFLTISFFAVYRSTQTTSKRIMKPALWGSWIALFVVILNDRLALIYLPQAVKYIVATTLAVLHIYNQRYCQCKNDKCCSGQIG